MEIRIYDPEYDEGCLCDDCMTLDCFNTEEELLERYPGEIIWNGNFGTLLTNGVEYDVAR